MLSIYCPIVKMQPRKTIFAMFTGNPLFSSDRYFRFDAEQTPPNPFGRLTSNFSRVEKAMDNYTHYFSLIKLLF